MRIACLLAALLAVACLAQQAPENLLNNPGFEVLDDQSIPEGWRLAPGSSVVLDEASAHSGKAFVRVRFEQRVSQLVPCEPGALLVIQGWVRAENPETKELPRVKTYFLNEAGGRALVTGGTMTDPGADGWARFEIPVRSPIDGVKISVDLIGAYGGRDWFWFDDVTMRQLAVSDWADYDTTPDLNGKTVVVPDLADVHTFASYRIPPRSLDAIDGLMSTTAWTGRSQHIRKRPPVCDFDIRFGGPIAPNWLLVHSASPMRPLGEAQIRALPVDRHEAGELLAEIAADAELIHSARFSSGPVDGIRLRLPGADQRTAEIQEIQVLEVRDGVTEPTDWQQAGTGTISEEEAVMIHSAYPAEADLQVLSTGGAGGAAIETKPGRTVHVLVDAAGDGPVGVKSLTVEMGAQSIGERDIAEVGIKLPEELDADIQYMELMDRGLEDRLGGRSARNYANLCQVLMKFDGSATVTFDIPDMILQPRERIWLTMRSARGLRIAPGDVRVSVETCSVEEALAEHLPRLERLATRAYALASEAHGYDSRPYQKMMLTALVKRVLEYDPDSIPGTLLMNRIARRWWPVDVQRPGPESAPDWAVWGRHNLRQWMDMAHWWIDNRWLENGEIGGNLNDDVEYTCHWPLGYLITGDDRIRRALGAIADAVWEQSGETGYSISATDVEHAAEDSSCSLPQMLLCEYGSPVHVERMMKMSEHIPFWTAVNEHGRRHFRSYIFNTTMIKDEKGADIDHLYCALAMCGATHLAWYCRNEQPWGWVHEYAQSWSDVTLSTEKGKPAGVLPCDVHWKTGEIAPYTDSYRKSVYYSFGDYVMIYFLSGVADMIEDPLLREAADLLTPKGKRAQDRVDGAFARLEKMPEKMPEDPSEMDGTWKGPANGEQVWEALKHTGDRSYLTRHLQELAREFERTRWLLTEAEPFTDRIPAPAMDILRYMYLGGYCAGKSHVPRLAVSWEGGGTNFAALVLEAQRDRLKALVYNFHDHPLDMTMRTWKLEHGAYAVTVGIDADGDDAIDQTISQDRVELFRYAGVDLTLPPGQVVVVEATRVAELDPITKRADLAISGRDIERVDGSTVMLTVHNIGAVGAPQAVVELVDEAGNVRASATLPKLAAPADLKPKTATVRLTTEGPVGSDWQLRVDPGDEVEEICEGNNRMNVGEPRPDFVYL